MWWIIAIVWLVLGYLATRWIHIYGTPVPNLCIGILSICFIWPIVLAIVLIDKIDNDDTIDKIFGMPKERKRWE